MKRDKFLRGIGLSGIASKLFQSAERIRIAVHIGRTPTSEQLVAYAKRGFTYIKYAAENMTEKADECKTLFYREQPITDGLSHVYEADGSAGFIDIEKHLLRQAIPNASEPVEISGL